MIKRIFHPIGQGAFYSERYDKEGVKFNIVYDCGCIFCSKQRSERVIKQSFNPDDEIDILFISHFDFDHVSHIKTLNDHVKKIKRVILPLLHKEEKKFLENWYKYRGYNDIVDLINDPEIFFGEGTEITEVVEYDERNINDNEYINIDRLPKEINSGLKICISNIENWCFIPYNFRYEERHKQLIENFKNKFPDKNIASMKDINFLISDIIKSQKNNGKKIKEIYEKVDGRINENSMFVYSGPCKEKLDYYRSFFDSKLTQSDYLDLLLLTKELPYCDNIKLSQKVGCLYTGDGNLNRFNLKEIFSDFWKNIGTLQIPHHGDVKSFDKKYIEDGDYYCVASVGKKNPYGHPSSALIADILGCNNTVSLVTEDLDSEYIEIIRDDFELSSIFIWPQKMGEIIHKHKKKLNEIIEKILESTKENK